VSDDGPGLPENESAPAREGVGLSNTRSRLSHLYGSDHGFEMSSAPGGGLEVRLTIPLRTEPRACSPRVVVIGGDDAAAVEALKQRRPVSEPISSP
jgi:signal transduction histidine kinase